MKNVIPYINMPQNLRDGLMTQIARQETDLGSYFVLTIKQVEPNFIASLRNTAEEAEFRFCVVDASGANFDEVFPSCFSFDGWTYGPFDIVCMVGSGFCLFLGKLGVIDAVSLFKLFEAAWDQRLRFPQEDYSPIYANSLVSANALSKLFVFRTTLDLLHIKRAKKAISPSNTFSAVFAAIFVHAFMKVEGVDEVHLWMPWSMSGRISGYDGLGHTVGGFVRVNCSVNEDVCKTAANIQAELNLLNDEKYLRRNTFRRRLFLSRFPWPISPLLVFLWGIRKRMVRNWSIAKKKFRLWCQLPEYRGKPVIQFNNAGRFAFPLDGLAWSPNLASPYGSRFYLTCGFASNENEIHIGLLSRHMETNKLQQLSLEMIASCDDLVRYPIHK